MATFRFVCNRFPYLELKAPYNAKFDHGAYETTDAAQADLLRHHEWMEPFPGAGGIIVYGDAMPDLPPMAGEVRLPAEPVAVTEPVELAEGAPDGDEESSPGW
jgi:hypothetical protein